MTKKSKLGNDPFSGLGWIKGTEKETDVPVQQINEPAIQEDALPVSQQNAKETNLQDPKLSFKKVTYYITPELDKKLKLLSVEYERDLSDLVREAIEDLHKKYSQA